MRDPNLGMREMTLNMRELVLVLCKGANLRYKDTDFM